MFEEKPGQWTDQPIIRIGQYICRTDFETFWKLIQNGQYLIYCQHEQPPFFSREKSQVMRSRRAAMRRFREKKIAFIDPSLYSESTQGLTEHDLFRLRNPDLYQDERER